MRHLALLAVVYLLAAALVLPGSLLASEEPAAPDAAQAGGEPAAPGAEQQEPDADPAPPADAPGDQEPAPSEPVAAPGPAPSEGVPAPPPAAVDPVGAAAPANEREEGAADGAGDAAEGKRDAAKSTRAKAAASTSVTIKDFEFSPTAVTIDVGDTVTWNNEGPTPHSATADNGSFDTGIFGKGGSRTETFEEAGTFSYFCTPHPFMKASVTVQASDSGAGDDGGSAGGADTGGSADDSAASESAADDGSSLPATGRDSGTLLVLGALMLALGLAVHRRARTG